MNRAEQANYEAADWLIAQADGPLSPDEQARFDAWMAKSDGNKAAYWRLELGWQEADRVVALGNAPDKREAVAGSVRRQWWWIPATIAASIVLAFGIQQFAKRNDTGFGPAAPVVLVRQSHSTAVGEMRIVGLMDGSRVQLNTGSKIQTLIGDSRREVWLEEGEAFFEVTHEQDRPFVVHAGEREITVLGTRFSVRRVGTSIVVTVLEGRVQLAEFEDGRAIRSSIISGGDIVVASGSATLVASRSPQAVQHALSWREGLLTFDQQPLAAIADEFNRYNQQKIVLDGASTGAIRISGTFPANKPDAFARLLRQAYGLNLDESEKVIRVHP